MTLFRFCLVMAAAASVLVGCLPDPGPFYPRPDDSTVAPDSPPTTDGPNVTPDTNNPLPDTNNPLPDGPGNGDTTVDMGSAAPTWTQVFNQVISPNCSCHMNGGTSGGLNMDDANAAYTNLVGVNARGAGPCSGQTRVVASDSSSSVLYNKLDGGGGLCGNQMPRNAPKLAQNLIDMVRDWIDAGAQQ
ncbi:MAG: hypothetical protein KC503_01825 [Myxococcales bacterium]|nr:hypothetical protein [Myxococcales bacterium]